MRRSMPMGVGLGLAAFVIAEIWLLGLVGQQIGVGWVMALISVAAVVGLLLMRHEGLTTWRALRTASDPGAVGERLTDAMVVVVGGVLLMLPGFLSDAAGLLCLVPLTQGWARRAIRATLGAATRPWRDQVDLMAAKLDPTTVVEGETIPGPGAADPRRQRPDDPTIIRGEIEP